jgi:PKD repeat protein
MSPTQAVNCCGTPTNGGGPNALVYNTNTVQLIASVPVDPPGGTSNLGSISGEYREVMRYEFAPAGVTPTAANEFYIYVSHYKASSGSPNTTYRGEEAGIIRTNSASLPSNARVLYVGDYNVFSSSEVSYQTIIGTGIGIQGIDPFNTSGSSTINFNDSSLMSTKSESATSLSARFDFQIMSSNVYNGVAGGLAYVPGTYHTFGNNGSTPYKGKVNSGSDTALNSDLTTNVTGITALQLYQYLTTATDHLPVVADYTIPVSASSPVASFSGSPTNGTAPLSVNFIDNSTGTIATSFWDFGDGGTTNFSTPTNVTYTYNTGGVYTVTLIATGPVGASTNTQVNLITVLTPPPVASFTANPTSGAAPLNVSFADISSGSITGWAWAFGDGNTSTNQIPADVYVNPGTYTVQEIVRGPDGSSTDTVVNSINVYDAFAWWQLNYFGGTNNPNSAPGADFTGTGMSNTNKFLAGFNPTNSAAYLHILSIATTNTTDIAVTYLGANGDSTYGPGIASRTNVLEFTTGTDDGSYSNSFLGAGQTNILSGGTGVGIMTNMVDPGGATNVPSRYYRIRVLVP